MQGEVQAKYGDTPGLFTVIVSESESEACERIEVISPKAHYNIWGDIWQDSHILWEDVRVENRLGDAVAAIPHERSGPMQVGDVLCGFRQGWSWIWVYEPEDKVLTRTN